MLAAISPTAVARHLCGVQSAIGMLYHSARLVRAFPGRFDPNEVRALREHIERGAFETWRCERLLACIDAANDEPASPAQA